MRKAFMLSMLLSILLVHASPGSEKFKKLNQWNHGDKEIYTEIYHKGIIDNDGDLVIYSGNKGGILITPRDVYFFAPEGLGPDDIYLLCAMCPYMGDIAMFEYNQKIKIFAKKENKYGWKETLWWELSKENQHITEAIFFKERWYSAGVKTNTVDNKKKTMTVSLLTVHSKEGKLLADFFPQEISFTSAMEQAMFFVLSNDNRIFFLAENELKVHDISPVDLKILKTVNLKIPEFYKKMPADFYVHRKYQDPYKDFYRDIQKWKTSYSLITNSFVQGKLLAIQTRTCNEKLKKFAVLFYDVENFELKDIFYTDDYLIAAREGVYYFYADGFPGFDDEADKCNINMYSFEGKK